MKDIRIKKDIKLFLPNGHSDNLAILSKQKKKFCLWLLIQFIKIIAILNSLIYKKIFFSKEMKNFYKFSNAPREHLRIEKGMFVNICINIAMDTSKSIVLGAEHSNYQDFNKRINICKLCTYGYRPQTCLWLLMISLEKYFI